MTIGRRALLGALAGALFVLMAHPSTRPCMVSVFQPPIDLVDPALGSDGTPPAPTTTVQAAVWLDVALGKLLAKRIAPTEVESTLRVVASGAASQPNNGLWPMAEATLLWHSGRLAAASRAWDRAYRCTTYDDLQADRWIAWRRAIATQPGGSASWPWAWILPNRSNSIATALGSYGRWRLMTTLGNADGDPTLVDRARTLLVLRRLRDGSRSVSAGLVGARLVEGATFPAMLSADTNPKRLVTARTEMVEGLRDLGRDDLAERVEDVLKDNEGWLAFVESADHRENARFWTLASVSLVSIPSALLASSLAGLLFLGLSRVVRVLPPISPKTRPVLAGILAIAMAGVAWSLSELFLPTLASALAGLFLMVGPKQVRTQEPAGLGPLHEVLTFLMGMICLATLALFTAGLTQASQTVLPSESVPFSMFGGSAIFASLAWLVVALLAATVPLWAVAQRICVRTTARLTLEIFGRSILIGGLVMATVAGFLSASLDHEVGRRLRMLVENEPANYYYNFR